MVNSHVKITLDEKLRVWVSPLTAAWLTIGMIRQKDAQSLCWPRNEITFLMDTKNPFVTVAVLVTSSNICVLECISRR